MINKLRYINWDIITISTIIVLFTSIGCSFLPLLNSLGYEFSVLHAIILFYLAGLITIKLLGSNEEHAFKMSFIRIYILIAAIPFVISFSQTLLFRVCPVWEGAIFYLIIAVPSMLFGIILGYGSFVAATRFKRIVFTLIFLFLLFFPLVEIYFRPQIYLYHSIISFFPGTIYDESIPIDLKMLEFRLYSMLPYFFTLLGVVAIRKWKTAVSGKWIIPFMLVVFAAYFSFKPALGFSTTNESLKNNLTGEVVTDHFIINYPQSIDKQKLDYLAMLHEYYFYKIAAQTGIKYTESIQSYVFKDNNQKRLLFGAGNADVAKPWLGQIYTSLDNYKNSLKHEIVHVIASKIGSTILKVADNVNPAIIEGYAMAVENNYAGYDIDYLAAVAKNSGYFFPFDELLSGFNFFAKTSSISYIYSGSFIKYLMHKYGERKVNAFYSNSNYEAIFGETLSNLETNYNKYLDSLNFKINRSTAQLFFGSLPLIKKVCPRVSANQLNDAWSSFGEGSFQQSQNLFDRNYEYSGAYSALIGKMRSRVKLGNAAEAFDISQKESTRFEESSYHFPLLIEIGDLAALNGKLKFADSLYSIITTTRPNEYYVCLAETRRNLIGKNPEYFKLYLDGNKTERFYILSKFAGNENSVYTIPLLLNLRDELNISYKSVNEIIGNIKIVQNDIAGYIYNVLSNYYLEQADYLKAGEYTKLSLQYSKQENAAVYEENLDKIVWISNFADKILNGAKRKDVLFAK